MTNFLTQITTLLCPQHCCRARALPSIRASFQNEENTTCSRRKIVTTFVASSVALTGLQYQVITKTPDALAQNWGTRSFIRERFFEPGLSPEDAVARIKQTAEGLHSIRDMLESMSWRYVIFYIRLKSAYLSQDLKNAMTTLPEARRQDYAKVANELVDNMAEFDYYVRTPKVYESYVYYEKTLKSIDDLVALLA
ncbi:photosynthetic NDH subunit of lumenal location 2, chloroplastic [Ziziphus jujuba]|uniref:Photosynthetic NDH subunit of lumenal location 2, chloroplastic n=1 Tax=Ziziphus jujuba TaxID=326968 RepID=A0A6P4B007_ZIZJJ|nr:photosynthetic NDH subunit of lumenal location 2, chloroplastic [Ziziphus jujuba]